MLVAAAGFADDPDPRAAGEAAALEALVACEGARYLLIFAGAAHAEGFADLVAGAADVAGDVQVTGVAGRAVVGPGGVTASGHAVAALALGGADLWLRTAQRPHGPASGVALARELGAPRDQKACALWPGLAAGDAALAEALAREVHPAVACSAAGDVLATAAGPREVEPGGTLAWLLWGPWASDLARRPAFAIAVGAPAADVAAVRARWPGLPMAGLAGAGGAVILVRDGEDPGGQADGPS